MIALSPKLYTTRKNKNGVEFRVEEPEEILMEKLLAYRGFFVVGHIVEDYLIEFTIYDYSEHDQEIVGEIKSILSSLGYREATF